MADTIVWWAWATEYPDDGMIPIEAGDATEALAAAHDALAAYAQEGEPMDVSIRRVTADDVHALQQRVENQAAKIRELEARAEQAERERDEARRQVAALTEGLRLVSDALARLDQIYRADTDLGDPPVETPAWLREAQHRAAALLAPTPPTPPAPTLTDTEPRPPTCECQWEAGDSPCRVHGEEVDGD